MAVSPFTRALFTVVRNLPKIQVRNLMSKQLVYTQFGDPLEVIKFRETAVPPLGPQEVLVRMLAAPVNPADINTIQGITSYLPNLPCVPGEEGVGEVVEIGSKVSAIETGERVIISSRLLGTWTYYGIYHEREVHVISPNLPLVEASMLSIAPSMAYRILKDFRNLKPGDTVIQNAANSAFGQCIIQLCKIWGIKTINIIANECDFYQVKEHLLNLGATVVVSIDEAEELTTFDTSMTRPALAINCLGGRYEDVLIKILEREGAMVYYGCALHLPLSKLFLRCDVKFYKFDLVDWEKRATPVEKDRMINELIQYMVIGKMQSPLCQPIELQNYVHAFRNTEHCEAFATSHFVFDFTLP